MYVLVGLDSGWQLIDSNAAVAETPSVNLALNGSSYAYHIGGRAPAASNTIYRWSLTSDGNSTDAGDLTTSFFVTRTNANDTTHAYTLGGNPSVPGNTDAIERFAFGASVTSADVGDLVQVTNDAGGTMSTTHGYAAGNNANDQTMIQKVQLAASANATDVGNTAHPGGISRTNACGSPTHGYILGGYRGSPNPPGGYTNAVEKFAFASDGDATDALDLLTVKAWTTSNTQSTTHGYSGGGSIDPGAVNTIEKFPFAADDNSTDVGDLTAINYIGAGASSTTHGYNAGGVPYKNVIQKWSFTTDGNASDVGDLNGNRGYGGGAQE